MPDDYIYTLTRICLRSGQLTLSQRMLGLFPTEGSVTAVDAEKNNEFDLTMQGKRQVTGVGKFIAAHNLNVNDQILIQPLEDTKFLFTPYKRFSNQASVAQQEGQEAKAQRLLTQLKGQRTALSEPEIRALYPELTRNLDLLALLNQDDDFVFDSGRWHTLETLEAADQNHEVQPNQGLQEENVAVNEALTQQGSLQEVPLQEIREPSAPQDFEEMPSVTSYTRKNNSSQQTGLASESEHADLEGHNRAKDLLRSLGYRVESLASGQLLAHAELGRRTYTAYIQILPQGKQLDWQSLLNRRRETKANYVAVFGDQQSLLRLGAPAGMARATLWSWSGLARVKDLMQVVPISPYDLETHFERDGIFEHGKERFEKDIGERIAERGVFSTVLSRLALMKAPSIFLLDDVVDDQVSRTHVLRVLENLSGAPFHMIAKVDSGEFCLRFKVSDSLDHISRYALSLKERLPSRFTEHLTGVADTEEDLVLLNQTELSG